MSNEELVLLSDFIKIGFPVLGTVAGTILGGFSTYLITRLNHQNEKSKEIARRRLELIMQTANDVTEFENLIGIYAVALSNKVRELDGGIDFEEAKNALMNKAQPLRRARMSLKVLGLKEAEIHLEEYLDLTREIVKRGPDIEREKVLGPVECKRVCDLAKIIARGPIRFYECLSREIAIK